MDTIAWNDSRAPQGLPVHSVSSNPVEYRLVRKPHGELVLQGAFQHTEGNTEWLEWVEIPTVQE